MVEVGAREFGAFRKAFYAEECALASKREEKAFERLAATQAIVRSSTSESTAEAVTVTIGRAGVVVVYRYRLKRCSSRWQIGGIDVLCPACQGARGNYDCGICSGQGWWPLGGGGEV